MAIRMNTLLIYMTCCLHDTKSRPIYVNNVRKTRTANVYVSNVHDTLSNIK